MNKGYSTVQTLTFKQTTILAPQLQQGVKLLALSSLDLQREIDLELERNPFLEKLDYDTGISAQPADSGMAEHHSRRDSSLIHAYTPPLPKQAQSSQQQPSQGTTSGRRSEEGFGGGGDGDIEQARELGLTAFLHEQARGTPLSDKQHHILALLIDSVNDNGYLRAGADEIVHYAMPEYVVKRLEVLAMISVLQDFEPVGVGARSPRECLQIQLNEYPEETPGLFIARTIVAEHLALLAKKNYPEIARLLDLSEAQLDQPVALIRKLNPFPGASLSLTRESTVVPDLLVKKVEGEWVLRLNPNVAPSIAIHDESAQLLKLAKGHTGYDKLKQELQKAQGLLSNLQRRYYTIYRIGRIMVERQTAFLEQGTAALRPLSQKQIAEQLELHVSTVSRAVSGKYISTPHGVLEMRYFFSSSIPGKDGEQVSSRAVQSIIRQIIESEPADKPLSDLKICALLEQQGFQLARRTVMKYRECLGIPSSPQRRKQKQQA